MTIYNPLATGKITVTVTRYGPSPLTRGQPTHTVSTFDITDANVQPASKTDLLQLSEGQRDRDVQIIFTHTDLLSAGQLGNHKADRVEYNGRLYEIFQVNTYRMGVLDHTEAIMVGVVDD